MTKRMKKISLLEFKAWLSGVEEMQPEDWIPNLEQWKLIRQKIDSIKDTVPPKSKTPSQNASVAASSAIANGGNTALPPPPPPVPDSFGGAVPTPSIPSTLEPMPDNPDDIPSGPYKSSFI